MNSPVNITEHITAVMSFYTLSAVQFFKNAVLTCTNRTHLHVGLLASFPPLLWEAFVQHAELRLDFNFWHFNTKAGYLEQVAWYPLLSFLCKGHLTLSNSLSPLWTSVCHLYEKGRSRPSWRAWVQKSIVVALFAYTTLFTFLCASPLCPFGQWTMACCGSRAS